MVEMVLLEQSTYKPKARNTVFVRRAAHNQATGSQAQVKANIPPNSIIEHVALQYVTGTTDNVGLLQEAKILLVDDNVDGGVSITLKTGYCGNYGNNELPLIYNEKITTPTDTFLTVKGILQNRTGGNIILAMSLIYTEGG